jgi:hypothetical protein
MRASMSPAGTSAAAVAGSAVRSRSASPRAVATRASTGDAAPSLLPWLSRVTNDAGLESRVALADGPYGRSLVALRQLTPDEVIFNVPFSLVFAEDDSSSADARNALETSEANTHGDDDGLPWSALMAMRLLEARAGVDRPELKTWIDSLPSFVSTPPLEYSDEVIEACHDPLLIGEAKEVRAAHLEAAAALRKRLAFVGCDADDLRWAAGALHSRCFTHGPRGTHLAVPGVDMCNHCFENPTAQVRVVTSPDACQGAAATFEIADAEHLENIEKSERFFQLRACEDGVEEGSEITISYGPWPNDPFFLYFGFVPNRNPNDTVALFADATEIEECASRLGLIDTKAPEEVSISSGSTETDGVRSISSTAARRRMMLTREGIDPEILEVARLLGVSDWRPLVEGRCLELLRAFPTTLKEDRALLDGGGLTDDEAVAVRYRMSKKEVLLGPIAQARAREAAREAGTK